MIGICENCGTVPLYKSRNIYRCSIGVRKSAHKYFEKTGICEICKEEKKLVRDHDHDCCDLPGKECCIRGFLCNKCNCGLGFFEDSSEKLQSAIDYLNKKGNSV